MTDQPKKRDAVKTRRLLLQAATAHFIEKGFDAARVDDIAAEAGVNKRLIYLYFGNKRDIYHEVLTLHIQQYIESSREIFHAIDDPYENAVYAVRHFFNYLAENPGFVRLLAWESLFFERREQGDIAKMLGEGLEPMLKTIRRGIQQGLFREDVDPGQLVISIVGLCLTYFQKRLLMTAVWPGDPTDPAQRKAIVDHIVQTIFHGVLAGPAWPSA